MDTAQPAVGLPVPPSPLVGRADELARSGALRVELTNFLAADGHFADEWTMSGVHTGDAPGLAATGRSFRIVGAGVGEVRDNEVVTATMYWNMADFLTQAGVLPSDGS